VLDPVEALRELARVIKPGGTLAILEFGEPVVPGVRAIYNWYFRQVLPRLGRLVSKHESAYSYLPASVGTFPRPADFAATISSQGFVDVTAVPLSLGIVYLYVASRA
jgi:demethylmenaquinone methyltransferase/2-methoxy-6-polyprenyl-1,4-benzoquinol methylase